MEAALIIAAAKEVASVIKLALEKIPSAELRRMDAFFEFEDKFNEEKTRADSDTDTIMAWRERSQLLRDTVIKEIAGALKK